jgi:lipopolysaccharide transport system permease protein
VNKVLIRPSRGWRSLKIGQLWEYRELLFFFTWRDVKVRYKQTALGVAWAVLQPLLTMLVFTLFLGKLGKMPSDGKPYALFTLAALVPWTFFANGLSDAANSVVGSASLVKKVYFPRLVIPVSSVFSGLVDFCLAMLVLFVIQACYRVAPTVNMIWLPLLVLMALATSLGVGLWLAALNVQFRDVRYVIPFMTQIWMFATPVVYPSSLLAEPWRTWYGVNPMAGVVEGFRWALLGSPPPGPIMLVSSIVAGVLLASGAFYFRRMERTFADLI